MVLLPQKQSSMIINDILRCHRLWLKLQLHLMAFATLTFVLD